MVFTSRCGKCVARIFRIELASPAQALDPDSEAPRQRLLEMAKCLGAERVWRCRVGGVWLGLKGHARESRPDAGDNRSIGSLLDLELVS